MISRRKPNGAMRSTLEPANKLATPGTLPATRAGDG